MRISDRLCLNLAAVSATITWLCFLATLLARPIALAMGLHRQDAIAQWGIKLLNSPCLWSAMLIGICVITPAIVLLGVFVQRARPAEGDRMDDKIWLNFGGVSAAITLLCVALVYASGPVARATGIQDRVMYAGWGMRITNFLWGLGLICAFLITPMLIFLGIGAGAYASMSRADSS